MKVTDCIECPKCHKPFLKQTKQDWYCHKCHTDFTTHELVHQWGLDAGDLYGTNSTLIVTIDKIRPKYGAFTHPLYSTHGQFSGYPEGEPYWYSVSERNDSYQMVSRMFLGISEIDDYADMLATQENALGIGVQ